MSYFPGTAGGGGSFIYGPVNIGNGGVGPYVINHGLGTLNPIVAVYKNSGSGLTSAAPNSEIVVTPVIIDANSFSISPNMAWGIDEFRVVVSLVTTASIPSAVGGLPAAGPLGSRPSAGTAGKLYFATDNRSIYRDNGSTWDAAALIAAAAVTVAASETTTSTSYSDLATTTDGVTVNIGPSGMALVTYGAQMINSVAANICFMAADVSGATTIAADDSQSAQLKAQAAGGAGERASNTYLLTGLSPGTTVFKAKYKSGGGTTRFLNRHIAVVPL